MVIVLIVSFTPDYLYMWLKVFLSIVIVCAIVDRYLFLYEKKIIALLIAVNIIVVYCVRMPWCNVMFIVWCNMHIIRGVFVTAEIVVLDLCDLQRYVCKYTYVLRGILM